MNGGLGAESMESIGPDDLAREVAREVAEDEYMIHGPKSARRSFSSSLVRKDSPVTQFGETLVCIGMLICLTTSIDRL